MANCTMYTRVYSKRSPRQLVSGRGADGYQLSDIALLEEFWNHANIWNRVPTALVSCSNRIVDTLKRAFDKHYENGEPLADIWIAFIEVPPGTNGAVTQIHYAKELAERCNLEEPNKFSNEVVFEWAIPTNYVVYEVSLRTLKKLGLRKRDFFITSLQKAPISLISHQLFYDCVWTKVVGDDEVRIRFAHEERTKTVDFQFFCDLDDGINTSLCDWWLSDIDFIDYEEFEKWRDETEDSIGWELIDFWETWVDVDCDGTTSELSAKDQILYDRAKNKLLAKHEQMRADIEVEAVRIGQTPSESEQQGWFTRWELLR
ncbi:hypothetical protein VE02_01922 [Pseudogymnoascus sp. 03VT05]|nr:hypothetical protein VE02_01922 [Pseudogymnoascus sp. 03VT05]